MAKCWVGFDGYGIEGVDEEFIHFVFDVAVTMAKLPAEAEVGVILCEDEYIQNLNQKYRGKDYVPNVLSFGYNEMQGGDFVDADPTYLGDVFISKSKVAEQASELGVGQREEFARLFVHGLLHLKGLDHATEAEAEAMEGLEDKILATVFA